MLLGSVASVTMDLKLQNAEETVLCSHVVTTGDVGACNAGSHFIGAAYADYMFSRSQGTTENDVRAFGIRTYGPKSMGCGETFPRSPGA